MNSSGSRGSATTPMATFPGIFGELPARRWGGSKTKSRYAQQGPARGVVDGDLCVRDVTAVTEVLTYVR